MSFLSARFRARSPKKRDEFPDGAGAVQDLLTAEARGSLFANVQNIVTGKITAEDALAAALALNK